MSKKTTTRYFCDRCGREIANNSPDPIQRYRLKNGQSCDLCSECDIDLDRFLSGEPIEGITDQPEETEPEPEPAPEPDPGASEEANAA